MVLFLGHGRGDFEVSICPMFRKVTSLKWNKNTWLVGGFKQIFFIFTPTWRNGLNLTI